MGILYNKKCRPSNKNSKSSSFCCYPTPGWYRWYLHTFGISCTRVGQYVRYIAWGSHIVRLCHQRRRDIAIWYFSTWLLWTAMGTYVSEDVWENSKKNEESSAFFCWTFCVTDRKTDRHRQTHTHTWNIGPIELPSQLKIEFFFLIFFEKKKMSIKPSWT